MVLYSAASQDSLNLCPVVFPERPQSTQQALTKQSLGTNDTSKRAGCDGFISQVFIMWHRSSCHWSCLYVIAIKYLPQMYVSEVPAFLWVDKELGIQRSKYLVRWMNFGQKRVWTPSALLYFIGLKWKYAVFDLFLWKKTVLLKRFLDTYAFERYLYHIINKCFCVLWAFCVPQILS